MIPVYRWKKHNPPYGHQYSVLFAGQVKLGSVCRALTGKGYNGTLCMNNDTVHHETEDGCKLALEQVASEWFKKVFTNS